MCPEIYQLILAFSNRITSTVKLARIWLNANVSRCLMEVNRLTNLFFTVANQSGNSEMVEMLSDCLR